MTFTNKQVVVMTTATGEGVGQGMISKCSLPQLEQKRVLVTYEDPKAKTLKNLVRDYGVEINNYLKKMEEENRI